MADLTALDLSQRPPQISWTYDMRKVLCCLIKYYERDWNNFLAIFNGLYQKELLECGFTDGKLASWARLNSQWTTLKKQGDPIWGDVHCSGFDREPWLPVLNKIEEIAAALGLTMVQKEIDSIDSSQFVYQDRVRQVSSQLGQQSQEAPSPSETQEVLRIDTAQYGILEELQLDSLEESRPVTDLLCTRAKKCFWCYLEGVDDQKEEAGGFQAQTPKLLYRWWNVDSQGINSRDLFVAGLFRSPETAMFAPDTISKEEFKLRVMNHIGRKHISSPFISTFQSALAPIHRGLWKKEGATVAIIDSTHLKQPQVFSAKHFCRTNSVRIGRTYNGGGEYLIWGMIPKDAIVCSFKITTLCEVAAGDPDIERFLQLNTIAAYKKARRPLHQAMEKGAMYLDQRAGAAVGRLLSSLGVPNEYYKAISEGLAYSWRVKTKHIPWRDFFEGVDLGYRGEYVLPSHSPSPVTGFEHTLTSIESDDNDGEDDNDNSEDEDNTPDVTDYEDDHVQSPRSLNANPTIHSDTNRVFPVDPERRSPTPFDNSQGLMSDHENDAQDELGVDLEMTSQDLDLFDEMVPFQQQTLSDQFAVDRARDLILWLMD
ncbi:hypothetical protein BJX63DRAFT_431913 [Aspergillus granulosus]|uniref:DUF7587 domain-containing protein n=1 Tax=Aspergillus granulosus TaxID=176169 RepID=A0ABR4HDU5_9EURO